MNGLERYSIGVKTTWGGGCWEQVSPAGGGAD